MNTGTKIYGYCNGYFGRDDYETKIIILEGATWIVCSYVEDDHKYSNLVTCANFESEAEKNKLIAEWREASND